MKKHKGGKHTGHGHTGKIRHKDMTSLIDGHGAKDPHADPAHHSANVAHDMPQGGSPMGEYDEGEGSKNQGMMGNEECC